VSDEPIKPRAPSITARPTAEEKKCFAELAASRGLSERTLALIAIRSLLAANGPPSLPRTEADRAPATDRITIRLRPGDGRAIADRAARRGLKCSAYLAGLVRAHVAANPPLAAGELAALKQAVSVLAALGRVLVRMSDDLLSCAPPTAEVDAQLHRTLHAVGRVEERVRDLAVAALKSWESRYG
jgi:hypothetical protein